MMFAMFCLFKKQPQAITSHPTPLITIYSAKKKNGACFWSNYSDLTRGKSPAILGKPRWRWNIIIWSDVCQTCRWFGLWIREVHTLPSADVVIVDPPRKFGVPGMDVPGKVLGSKFRISGLFHPKKILSHLEAQDFCWRFQANYNWCRISAINSSNYSFHAMLLKQTCSILFRWMDSKIILNSTTLTIDRLILRPTRQNPDPTHVLQTFISKQYTLQGN